MSPNPPDLVAENKAVAVPWARVALESSRPWPPISPNVIRGALVSALDRLAGGTGLRDRDTWRAHVDWHGHITEDDTRQALPPVVYRAGVRPRVWLCGPRTSERLSELARVRALTLPAGEVIPVTGMEIEQGVAEVRQSRDDWWRYRTVTPIFPPRNSRRRKPGGWANRRDGWEVRAWAGGLLSASIAGRLADWGWAPPVPIPAHVQVLDYQAADVRWTHATRTEDTDFGVGFHAEFACNACLPPGAFLGARGAAGFGEIAELR